MPSSVVQSPGLNGLPRVVLTHPSGPTAEVYLFGATLTSYRTGSGKEVMFVSKQSNFDGKKGKGEGTVGDCRTSLVGLSRSWWAFSCLSCLAVDQFGQPKKEMPSHGFARITDWTLRPGEEYADDVLKAVFELRESPASLAMWPFPFLLTYTVALSSTALSTSLRIHNPGTAPFPIMALLHTYYSITSIQQIGVKGFSGLKYHDKVNPSPGLQEETREVVTIAQEVDRVYGMGPARRVSSKVDIFEAGTPQVSLAFTGFKEKAGSGEVTPLVTDCVLWNPWVAKSQALADFGDEEFNQMVCVEPGLVSDFQEVAPGESVTLEQTITPASVA